eukprot:TRINITY_DN56_c0_g1_i1.p1 TRINITY_DN56_c0_g1~~TRINITY_DN56_c0_g1_i1.p1  ORF type:complete len:528 (-),score=74.73 TRINITY_DN56_c0_g1_i1:1104-2615(-)
MDREGLLESAPLIKKDESADATHESYGSFAAFSFTVNFIMGVGILSLPYAFFHAGVLMSPLFLVLVSLLSFVTVMYIFESGARCEALTAHQEMDVQDVSPHKPQFHITNRRFDMRTMSKMFMGLWGWHFDISLILFTYGGQWSFAATFASSLTNNIRLPFMFNYTNDQPCNVYATDFTSNLPCLHTYYVYVALFSLIVIPLSCVDLADQAWLQMILTLFRFICVTLIVSTVAYGLAAHPFPGALPVNGTIPSGPPYTQPTSLVTWAGFGNLFTTALFAQMMHNAAPNIAQPVRDKSKLPYIFIAAFATTFGAYALIGVLCAVFFGGAVAPTVTLMWSNFNGWLNASVPAPWWAEAVHWILALFPPIDVISAYPLGSISLATNLMSSLPLSLRRHPRWKLVKLGTNLISAIPPLVGALFVWNLSTIINVSGLFAFFIVFITPALLVLLSRKRCMDTFGEAKTPYSLGPFSHPLFASVILVIGTVSLALSIGLIINPDLLGTPTN